MPRFSITRLPGALVPKASMPSALPWSPTNACQPSVTPASIETRFLQAAGSTDSRYAASCRAKRDQHGSDTTRVPAPSSFAAATACCTSLPVAIRIVSSAAVSFTSTYPPSRAPSRRVAASPGSMGTA